MAREVVITQFEGGVGATTLAMHIVHADVWPLGQPRRLLVPANPADIGDAIQRFRWATRAPRIHSRVEDWQAAHNLASIAIDAGNADESLVPTQLYALDPDRWVVPVVPTPDANGWFTFDWLGRLRQLAQNEGYSLVYDAGRYLPPFGSVTRHDDLYEQADLIVAPLRSWWALSRMATTLHVHLSKVVCVRVGHELTQADAFLSELGIDRVLDMPWTQELADVLSSSMAVAVEGRKTQRIVEPYMQLVVELADLASTSMS